MKKIHLCLLFFLTMSVQGSTLQSTESHTHKTEKEKEGKKRKESKKSKKTKETQQSNTENATPVPEKPQIERNGLLRVTKQKDEWFFEIPDSLLGRLFLTTTRYTAIPSNDSKFAGEQLNQQTVYFDKGVENQLLLRAKHIINVADTSAQINRAILISNVDPIIGSFKILSTENNRFKIKVNDFFNQDNPAIGLSTSNKQQFGLQGMVNEMSFIEDIKSFPMNTEVRTIKTFNHNPQNSKIYLPSAASTGKATFGLNLSFVLLPEKPMQRRFYDPRVGYFTDRFTSFSDHQQRVERKEFITRWRLEPRPEDVERMKKGELVEPIKPIVYYIDPATPKQWRKYLIQGVLDWQVAFEKAGFKNAIQAYEWPENDSTMSMEDARYSCIRYLASPIENAYGPNVHDPRTGEILESHICWYHNVMSLLHTWYMVQASSIDEAARKMRFDEELMGELIRFVSSHEVGHALGLRHNFGSSSTVPVDSLRNKDWVEKYGHTPSIMDYARFNYVAQPEDGITRKGIFPRINDYDLWAITWGYKPMIGAKDEYEDHNMLEEMTANAQNNPRLWWGDGEASEGRLDPRRQTEDLGDNAMKASHYGILNLKREAANLKSWTSDDPKDLYGKDLQQMYNEIRIQLMRYAGHVSRNIGGYLIQYKGKTENGDVYTPQPLKKQKEALTFMNKHFLNEPQWMRNSDYARRLTAEPESLTNHIATSAMTQLMDRLGFLNELYPPLQYMTDLRNLTFSETKSGEKVTPYRMTLQNTMFEHLSRALNNGNTKVRPAVLKTLQELQKQTLAASKSANDAESRAHWADMYDKISRLIEWK